jgi:hypothetical protein
MAPPKQSRSVKHNADRRDDPWVIYDWRIARLNVAARFGATVVGAEVQPRFDQTDLRRNSNRPGSQVVAFVDLCNCARRVRHGE